jgi:hypothetical protein
MTIAFKFLLSILLGTLFFVPDARAFDFKNRTEFEHYVHTHGIALMIEESQQIIFVYHVRPEKMQIHLQPGHETWQDDSPEVPELYIQGEGTINFEHYQISIEHGKTYVNHHLMKEKTAVIDGTLYNDGAFMNTWDIPDNQK